MKNIYLAGGLCCFLLVAGQGSAAPFHGVEFPGGISSFADSVINFSPVISGGGPTAPYLISSEAVGAPDYPEGPTEGYVSLGSGGSLTLGFLDNSLTGSGSPALDLWIFEIGPDVEDTFVEVSKDGSTWHAVGKVFGSTSGIDLDAFGWTTSDFFSFVRLRDDPSEGATTGTTVGADIDAVGAISTAPPVRVPEVSSTLLLLAISCAALCGGRRAGWLKA